MRRVVVFAVIVSLGHASVAMAGESVLGTAVRVVRDAVRNEPLPAKPAMATEAQRAWSAPTVATTILSKAPSANAQEAGALSTSGLRKRTKIMILLGAAAGFAASAWVIDHKVEDNTPSSHNLRED
jgi:hypothetical protein